MSARRVTLCVAAGLVAALAISTLLPRDILVERSGFVPASLDELRPWMIESGRWVQWLGGLPEESRGRAHGPAAGVHSGRTVSGGELDGLSIELDRVENAAAPNDARVFEWTVTSVQDLAQGRFRAELTNSTAGSEVRLSFGQRLAWSPYSGWIALGAERLYGPDLERSLTALESLVSSVEDPDDGDLPSPEEEFSIDPSARDSEPDRSRLDDSHEAIEVEDGRPSSSDR